MKKLKIKFLIKMKLFLILLKKILKKILLLIAIEKNLILKLKKFY